jgi:hypothetical protein
MGPYALSPIAHLNWRVLRGLCRSAWRNSGHRTGPAWATGGWRSSPQERVRAVVLVVLLHAVAIATVWLAPSTVAINPAPGIAALAVEFGGAPRPKQHSARRHHPRQSLHVQPTPALLPQGAPGDVAADVPDALPLAPASLQEVSLPQGAGCDLTQPVQDALRNNAAVRRLLPSIPAGQRSVANAIVVWNAHWIDPESIDPEAAAAQAAYAAIRKAISQQVASTSADCRNQVQTGPRLIYLPGSAGSTTVLALGSGTWSWQQLIDGGQPLPASALIAAPAAPLFAPPNALAVKPPAADPSPALNALLASLIRQQPPQAPRNR